jgi:DNA replication protein DnaC
LNTTALFVEQNITEEATAMLNDHTFEKLSYMKLRGMAAAFRQQMEDAIVTSLSFEERFGLLVDAEYLKRRNTLLLRLLSKATFKDNSACLENIEYHEDRKLDRALFARLSACTYIAERRDVVIMGATGSGKTYIGCALGNAACRKFITVKYVRLPELLVDLSIARGDGSYRKIVAQYQKYGLLIIDEWLLSPLDVIAARDLLEIIEARHENASTIFLSQSAPAGWYERLGEGTVADAVLDRIIHNSYEIVIEGVDSMRKRKSFKKDATKTK